jgi:Domain of unknown function (DUF4388)
VSLEGTLETIALPDVLALLSVTAKTGELRIEAGGGVGSVWFDTGRLAGYEVGNHKSAVDALFALLRLKDGSFKFHTGTQPVNATDPVDVAPVLEEAENRLVQWPGIAAVVPSLYCGLKLQGTVEATVTLRPDQWQLVVAIGDGRPVVEVLSARGLGEYEGCKAVKELVDVHLVQVSEGEAPPGQPEGPLAVASVPAADLSDVSATGQEPLHWHKEQGPRAEEANGSEIWEEPPVEAPVAEVEAAPEEPAPAPGVPVNRGLLLKFLGSARN